VFPERKKVEHDLREEVKMSLKSVRHVRERKERGKELICALSPHRNFSTYQQSMPIFHPQWVSYAQRISIKKNY